METVEMTALERLIKDYITVCGLNGIICEPASEMDSNIVNARKEYQDMATALRLLRFAKKSPQGPLSKHTENAVTTPKGLRPPQSETKIRRRKG